MVKDKLPPVLDVCCGTKAFWFDKEDERAIFHDIRNERYNLKADKCHPARTLIVTPDVCGDFSKLQFESNTFALVVFDPPHMRRKEAKGAISKTYGVLNGDWREMLRKGFSECFRVLRSEGVLIFKWCEIEVPLREILSLTKEKPLFGHRSGRLNKTHWVAFIKGGKN